MCFQLKLSTTITQLQSVFCSSWHTLADRVCFVARGFEHDHHRWILQQRTHFGRQGVLCSKRLWTRPSPHVGDSGGGLAKTKGALYVASREQQSFIMALLAYLWWSVPYCFPVSLRSLPLTGRVSATLTSVRTPSIATHYSLLGLLTFGALITTRHRGRKAFLI